MPCESAAQLDPNLAILGAWLDREGYRADLRALRPAATRDADPGDLAAPHQLGGQPTGQPEPGGARG